MGDAATREPAYRGAGRRAWWRCCTSRSRPARSASRRRSAKATSTATNQPVPSRAAALDEFVALAGVLREHAGHDARVHPYRRADPGRAHGAHGRHVARGRPRPQLEPARQPRGHRDLRTAVARVRRRGRAWRARRRAGAARHDAHAVERVARDAARLARGRAARRRGPARRGRRPGDAPLLRAGAERGIDAGLGVLVRLEAHGDRARRREPRSIVGRAEPRRGRRDARHRHRRRAHRRRAARTVWRSRSCCRR